MPLSDGYRSRDYLNCQISRIRWCLDHHRLPNVYAERNARVKLMRLNREYALLDNDAYKPTKGETWD